MKTILFIFSLLLFPVSALAASYVDRPDVQQFIQRMVDKHQFDRNQLIAWLQPVETQTSILEAIQRPAEKTKKWFEYRDIFLTQSRIDKGISFWKENWATLEDACNRFGVPPEIVVAIIGVETFYGDHTGRYSVLDSLVTLGFDYPKRSEFFLNELEEFLLLSREQSFSPPDIQGSYAGAMGKGQFIASSYRHYAIDFNGDQHIDLWSNQDAIGSVANYFSEHGWKRGEPIIEKAMSNNSGVVGLSVNELVPAITAGELQRVGVSVEHTLSEEGRYSLLQLDGEAGLEYWVGHHNFYVITRYNHSVMYALAVYQLAEAIKQQINKDI